MGDPRTSLQVLSRFSGDTLPRIAARCWFPGGKPDRFTSPSRCTGWVLDDMSSIFIYTLLYSKDNSARQPRRQAVSSLQ